MSEAPEFRQAVPGTASTPLLELRDLTVSFRRDDTWNPVVRGLSFDIARGETVAVVGESGSGKSVTAMSILGLLPKATSRVEGAIRFDGRELLTASAAEMRMIRGNRIAMIFQEPSLNPVYSVGFHLVETLRRHRNMSTAEARAEAVQLLEKVRIPSAASRLDDYPHQFSGGMRQRVMIAIALACKPALLIADEPTTALDVTIQAQILELIKELQDQEGMSVLFITHDMGVVAEISDRTVVMYRGDVVEIAPTPDVLTKPGAPYSRRLLAAVPRLGDMRDRSRPARFSLDEGTEQSPPLVADEGSVAYSTAKSVLQVRDLTTRFDVRSGLFGRVSGRVHAVEKVSFDIGEAETLSLVGESGCGKSTTGRSVIRLISPTSGSVHVDGVDVASLDAAGLHRMRKGMQMIFQDPISSLNAKMTIGEAIAEPFVAHRLGTLRQAREKAGALLARVGLEPSMMTRFPHEFSGGQRQRISIARALMLDPKIIIADESVSALDVSVKAQVVNLLLDLQESMGLSYLFISHDMAVVERVSHRVAVMYLGEIVEIGPRRAIFENPQHPYTRKLIAAVPVPEPGRRDLRRGVSNDEIKSPIRPVDYAVPERKRVEVGEGHYVYG